ncbi:hypothetical protein ZYGR_0BB00440 [Zygosaccharomyces rouxii]|uniref:Meiotic nuclear division protein 1 n=1 Tax=Zygosaccharomyces rouxii TaxID=4956 RepID=A0A1Q3AKI7_ZYGRO|nr:hypothetical protein ZYGR_0BB00440 [Zygosaccharomyces rouxii]
MPPKKQVVTLEEKKSRILNFFQEDFSFYNMKELEKLIPKKCGISSMLVKDLVQQMIDEDGIVSVEKCGNINVYWCFKNQITQRIYDSCHKISQQCQDTKTSIEDTKSKLDAATASDRSPNFENRNGDTLSRCEELTKHKELEEHLKFLQLQYNQVSQSRWDHDKIRRKRQEIRDKRDKLEKTTDNVEILVEYLCKRFCLESKQLRKELEIPDEFEEIPVV